METQLTLDPNPRPLACALGRAAPRYSVRMHHSIREVDPVAWDRVVSGRSLMMQRATLEAIERGSPGNREHRHAVFSRDGKPIGVACFEIARFEGPTIEPMLGESAAARLAARVAGLGGQLSFDLLVCGSTFSCGEHGFAFVPDAHPREALTSLYEAIRRIRRECRHVAGMLFKEFDLTSGPLPGMLDDRGFSEIPMGAKMVLDLDPSWDSFEGYLVCLKSKFRIKAKRARTKSRNLRVADLGLDDLVRHRTRLESLRDAVIEKATYRLGGVNVGSLIELRRALSDEFVIRGYWLGDDLVGFMTGFVDGGTLDAHTVGFDYRLNRDHSIYPRMLVDYLEIAIDRGLARVNYGRTAEEIKSTLGAAPVPTRCYVRHRSHVVNPMLPLVARYIRPEEFTQRRPFKSGHGGLAPGREAA
ncbi:MAG: GNAT family N-acetyltransferase [Deltaproteobacteria bacterium]|nr:GNAT family N-acetyltransferase [Deltaproteobacteria bacterium]